VGSFKVNVKGMTNVQKSIRELFNEVRKDRTVKSSIGDAIVKLTKQLLRSGKNPNADGGQPSRNHPISKGWVDRKERLKEYNRISPYYRKGASNLTFTGQLIDSINYKLKSSGYTESIIIEATGTRKPYKGVKKESLKGVETNAEVVKDLKSRGRDVFGITKQMVNIANKIVRTELVKKLRLFKRR
jgi:hypothetical protein